MLHRLDVAKVPGTYDNFRIFATNDSEPGITIIEVSRDELLALLKKLEGLKNY